MHIPSRPCPVPPCLLLPRPQLPRPQLVGSLLLGSLLLGSLLLGACESVPGVPVDTAPAAGAGSIDVEILDRWFVRVDGRRVSRHEFLYQTRLDGRDWARKKLPAPKVNLSWVEGAAPRPVVDELITQLRLAGVEFIDLGSE